jgi:hypothetical protein
MRESGRPRRVDEVKAEPQKESEKEKAAQSGLSGLL